MKWFLFFIPLFLQACSNLPANIKNPPASNIQLSHVAGDSHNYQNAPVRWGGTVIEVENEANISKMQILFYPLGYYGRPKLNHPTSGRFMATSKQFLDPAVFQKGNLITIAGTLQDSIQKQIGKKQLTMPVVAIENHHQWPQNKHSSYYYDYPYRNSFGFGYGYGYGLNYYNRFYPYSFYRGGYGFNGCY